MSLPFDNWGYNLILRFPDMDMHYMVLIKAMFTLLPDIKLGFIIAVNVYRLRDHVNDKTKLPILIFPEGKCYNGVE